MRKIRCNYASPDALVAAMRVPNTLEVFTTDGFEPGEEVMLELSYQGLAGKMMVRAVGSEWRAARPRLKVRAGGKVLCTGTEWRKLQFLEQVATGKIELAPRRRHVRLPVLVEVRWRMAGDRTANTTALSEISEGGALLLGANPPEIGTELIIEIVPPGSARPIEITATVRNHNPEGAGLQFQARDMGGVHRLREVIRRLIEQ